MYSTYATPAQKCVLTFAGVLYASYRRVATLTASNSVNAMINET